MDFARRITLKNRNPNKIRGVKITLMEKNVVSKSANSKPNTY